jgi:NIPSNAP
MIYGVCTIEVPPGKVNEALAGLGDAAAAGHLGALRGCWYSEIGRLNRILMIAEHPSGDALAAAHQSSLASENPFGVAGIATAITLDAYATFPGVEFLPSGNVGPVFEVRTYQLKRSGLTPTFAAWAKVLKARMELSPLAVVMYAVNGVVPRFMHIWPFRSLNERMSIRADAVKQGVWPPPGGLQHIESMQSEIFLPAAFSPLQ